MDGAAETPPFGSIAIIGLGLIGGSIALGVRERWPSVRVLGYDRPAVIAHALGSGALDRAATGLDEVAAADLVVLAAPIRKNIELLADIGRLASPRTLITDVGSTKRQMMEAARALLDGVTFVGGHPLGGAEHGGFGFARPDLFKGRPWIFTTPEDGPGAGATGDATTPDGADGAPADNPLARLFAFVRGLGARPSTMTPEAHDRLMAFVSHVPQLAASALMETVGRGASADGLRLAGRGLIDTTRLASSPAAVWRDVCLTNGDAIGEALDLLIARLQELRADLGQGDSLERVFADAARWRGDLMKGRDS